MTVFEFLQGHAHGSPGAPAILAPGRRPLSYAGLLDQVRYSVDTLNQMGCGRGDRIAVALPPGPETPVALLSVLAGSVCVPLNPECSVPEFVAYLSQFRVCALLTRSDMFPHATRAAAACGVPTIALEPMLSAEAGRFALRAEWRACAARPGFSTDDDLAAVFPTSGTTSLPKLIPLTQADVCSHGTRAQRYLHLTSADRCLDLMPAFHHDAVMASILSTIVAGASSIYPLTISAPEFMALVQELLPTWCAAAPPVFERLLSEARLSSGGAAPRGLRLLFTCGAPLHTDTVAALEQVFGAPFQNSYGATECGGITINPMPPHVRKRGSVGTSVGLELAILDAWGQQLPPGQAGEIVVRGSGVFRGYEGDPDGNAQTFVGDWYRTGDEGYLDNDGYLFLTGRVKDIINRGGEKIAPQEIDDVLRQHPAIQDAAAFGVPHPVFGEDVAAVVILRQPDIRSEQIRRFALEHLAAFKVPRVILIVSEIPKGPTGKVQRGRMAALFADELARAERTTEPVYEPPRTPLEALLTDLWAEVLGVARVGIHDNFFNLGGDSLCAAVVAARVHAALNVELDLRAFVAHPTLVALASVIDDMRHAGEAGTMDSAPRLVRVSRDVPFPLSFEQERIWQYAQTAEAAGYTVACSHRLCGPLDIGVLRESMMYIAQRHDILRTTVEVLDGTPVQVVHPAAPVALPLVDLSDASDAAEQATHLFRQEARRPFHLAGGGQESLVRFVLVRIRLDEHWLFRVNHHLIADGWSWTVYFRELALLYEATRRGEAPPLPAYAPLQYGDYAAWQRHALDPAGPRYRAAVDWWSTLLADTPPPRPFPFSRPHRLGQADPADGCLRWGLDPVLSERLARVARAHGVTYYMIRLAAFGALLAAHAGQPAVVLGTYVTQRRQVALQQMCGDFSNLVTLRLPWDPTQSFRSWLATVRTMVGDMQAHGAIPYEQLCEALRQRGVTPPDIRAIFSVEEHTAPVRFGGLELTWYDSWLDLPLDIMPWGFSVVCNQHQEDRRCGVAFDARLYDPALVRVFINRFVRLLEAASRHPDLPLATLLAMSDIVTPPPRVSKRWWPFTTDLFHRHTWRARG